MLFGVYVTLNKIKPNKLTKNFLFFLVRKKKSNEIKFIWAVKNLFSLVYILKKYEQRLYFREICLGANVQVIVWRPAVQPPNLWFKPQGNLPVNSSYLSEKDLGCLFSVADQCIILAASSWCSFQEILISTLLFKILTPLS